MARNQEKAQSILSRWRAAQAAELSGEPERRPYLASRCETLPEAEKWRRQILKQVTRDIASIQNAGLGEHKIRDLNDTINRLLREKHHWENRIIELGGPNYKRAAARILDREGREVPGSRGYKYFGAAKDLPGVRELFEDVVSDSKPTKTRGELYQRVDADYFGYRDEDDGVLIPLEQQAEQAAIAKAVAEWQRAKEAGELDDEDEEMGDTAQTFLEETKEEEMAVDKAPPTFRAHVDIPTRQDIERLLVERQKKILLQQYASTDLMMQEEQTKQLSGRT